jgi:hypothetical protein
LKVFENFRFLFFLYPFNQRHHLLNLSRTCSFGSKQDNTSLFLQIYFTFKGYLFISIKKVRTFAVIAGSKPLYTNTPFFKGFLIFHDRTQLAGNTFFEKIKVFFPTGKSDFIDDGGLL